MLLTRSLLRGGKASKDDEGGDKVVWERGRQSRRKSSKRIRKVNLFFFLKRENGPKSHFCFFFPYYSSPTARLAKRWHVLVQEHSKFFNKYLTKIDLCANVIDLVKCRPQHISSRIQLSTLTFLPLLLTVFFPRHPSLLSYHPLPRSLSVFLALVAVGRQPGRADRSSNRQRGNACPLKWNWGPVELSSAWLAWSSEGKERETKLVKCRVKASTGNVLYN